MLTRRFRSNGGINIFYPFSELFVASVARWAYYGMKSEPMPLKFGKIVHYRRWHDNYIRIGVILPHGQLVRRIAPLDFYKGRWTAFIELRGNTLKYDKVVVLASTFEAEDLTYYPTEVLAFKLKEFPRYWVLMEENHWTCKLDGKRIIRYYASKLHHQEVSAETMVDYCLTVLEEVEDAKIRKELETFMKNFYFLPRSKDEVKRYWRMEEYDVWVEDDVEWLALDNFRCLEVVL